MNLGHLVRVKQAVVVHNFVVTITFEDGTEKTIDLEPFLKGPVFAPILQDPALFRDIRIEAGTITWPNGADIDPDVLYYGLTPAPAQESAPSQ
jgi:hypothetical protein